MDDYDLHEIQNRILEVRDDLDPIIKGEIQKGRNVSQYSISPEFRKTTLKDARIIAKVSQEKLNRLAEDIFPSTSSDSSRKKPKRPAKPKPPKPRIQSNTKNF